MVSSGLWGENIFTEPRPVDLMCRGEWTAVAEGLNWLPEIWLPRAAPEALPCVISHAPEAPTLLPPPRMLTACPRDSTEDFLGEVVLLCHAAPLRDTDLCGDAEPPPRAALALAEELLCDAPGPIVLLLAAFPRALPAVNVSSVNLIEPPYVAAVPDAGETPKGGTGAALSATAWRSEACRRAMSSDLACSAAMCCLNCSIRSRQTFGPFSVSGLVSRERLAETTSSGCFADTAASRLRRFGDAADMLFASPRAFNIEQCLGLLVRIYCRDRLEPGKRPRKKRSENNRSRN